MLNVNEVTPDDSGKYRGLNKASDVKITFLKLEFLNHLYVC